MKPDCNAPRSCRLRTGTTSSFVLAMACALLLAACGGGGGGGGDTQAPPPPPPPPPATDTTPDAYAFTNQSDVDQNAEIESEPVAITGINAAASVSINGGEYSIDGAAYTSSAGTIDNGQEIRVRLTSSSALTTTVDATLLIGGVAATFSVTTLADTTPPQFSVAFPPQRFRTDGDSIIVRGTATDDLSEISRVSVNGVSADSDDGFATWSATVPLVPGANTLQVEAEDAEANTDSAAVANTRSEPYMRQLLDVAVDSDTDRVYVVDSSSTESFLSSIVELDLTSGTRTVLSDNSSLDGDLRYGALTGIELDPANDRIIAVDGNRRRLVTVDRTTGIPTILSAAGIPNDENNLVSPRGLALDLARNRALVADVSLGAVVAVDLSTGVRTILSDGTTPNPRNVFVNPASIVVDSIRDRALVLDVSTDTLLAVDLADGNRTVLSANDFPDSDNAFVSPVSVELDIGRDRALVSDISRSSRGMVLAVDLTSGVRTVFSDNNGANTNVFLDSIDGMSLDPIKNRVIVVGAKELRDGNAEIQEIDLTTGVRSRLASNSTPSADSSFAVPTLIAFDSGRNRLHVFDFEERALLAVDPVDGVASILSDSTVPNAEIPFVDVLSFASDDANNRLLVLDNFRDRLLAVDLDSGIRTVFSDSSTPNASNPFERPLFVSVDSTNNRALVLDVSPDQRLIAVDLETGERSVFAGSLDGLSAVNGMVVDQANNRLLLAPFRGGSVEAIDLDSGSHTVLSGAGIPDNDNLLELSSAIAIDTAGNRALVGGSLGSSGGEVVMAVDLTSGVRTLLSGGTSGGPANEIAQLRRISVDPVTGRIFVVDALEAAVFEIDPVNGQRVILSR